MKDIAVDAISIDERRGAFLETNDSTNKPHRPLLHFHVCVHCGSAFRREALEGRSITSGIFLCLKCGREGPLNVEIREAEEPGNEDPDSSSRSSG